MELRRNGPVLAIYGDNLMKFAPALGSGLAAAIVNGTTPTVDDLVASSLWRSACDTSRDAKLGAPTTFPTLLTARVKS